MTTRSLTGKYALVAGASHGIGRVTAFALAEAGAHVLVHYVRKSSEAQTVVAAIRESGGRADAVGRDLATREDPQQLAAAVGGIVGDRLDILVANAGVTKSASLEDTPVDDFEHLLAVNVRAPFFLVQQLLPLLPEDASVILVSSRGAPAVEGTIAVYSATQGATGRAFTIGLQALKRLAGPVDVAAVAAFLASDEARWITGDTLRAAGGSKLQERHFRR